MTVAYNHRITVLACQMVQTAVGQSPSWTESGKRWANVRLLGGLATIRADAATSVVKASIRLRYCSDVDAPMRLAYDGITYDIKARLPDPDREFVDFVCESVQ
jgi:SPP1 family predicted phage head-tail adaptor